MAGALAPVGAPGLRAQEVSPEFQKTFLGKHSENTVENPRPRGATFSCCAPFIRSSEVCLSDLDAPAL